MQKIFLGIKPILLIFLSVILVMVLMLISLPDGLDFFRPQLVALIVIYWVLHLPEHVGMVFAFAVGLVLDILYNVPFGEHALALVLIAYIVIKWHVRIGFFNFGQKIALIFVLVVLYQMPIFLFALATGKTLNVWSYWLAPFISALIWPYLEKFAGNFKKAIINGNY